MFKKKKRKTRHGLVLYREMYMHAYIYIHIDNIHVYINVLFQKIPDVFKSYNPSLPRSSFFSPNKKPLA